MDHWSAEARLLQADESGDVPWTYRQTSLLRLSHSLAGPAVTSCVRSSHGSRA